jgi:hypothetical protein
VPYNKQMTNQEMPFLTITCSKEQPFFILTHLLERQMPQTWREFFEKSFNIAKPDLYQFHCFLIKTNKFMMN